MFKFVTADYRGPYRFLCFIKGSGLWLNKMGLQKEKHSSEYLAVKKHNSGMKFSKTFLK